MPADGVTRHQMSEELSDDAQPIGLVPVDSVVILCEHVLEQLPPKSVEFAEALTDEPKELVVSAFLAAALDDHARQFVFTASGKIDAHELVTSFLEAARRHDCQVNGTTKVDKVRVRLVLDLHRLLSIVLAGVRVACVVILVPIILILAARFFTQDLSLELSVHLFVRLPLRIELEDVRSVFGVQSILQTRRMCDLIFLFHKVQLFFQRRIVLVFVFPDLEQNFNHVLHSLVNVRLVEDTSELVVDGKGNLRVHLLHVLANFLRQANRNLHTIVCRLVQEQEQYLSSKHFMCYLLVDQMRDEGSAGLTNALVVALEGLSELCDESVDQKLANFRQFGIHDRYHGRVDWCERQTGSLGLHDTPAEQATSTNQVLVEQLWHDVLDVRHVDFVDQSVDALLQGLPSHALVFLRSLVGDLCLERP